MKLFTNCWAKLTLGKTYFAVVFIFLFGAVAIEITLIAESLPDAIKTPAEAHQQAEPTTNTLESPANQNQRDNQKSFEKCLKDAEAGIPEAQYKLSVMYASGDSIAQDKDKSAEWCQRAADAGHPDAQFDVGIKYQTGNFYTTTPDYVKAFEWYQKAAASGHHDVQWRMGFMYIYGEGVPQDNEKAVECFQKGAASGCRISIARLNWMYKNSKNLKKSKDKADYSNDISKQNGFSR